MMNWRTLLLRFTAKMLEDIGMHGDASRLRALHVSPMDCGGFRIGRVRRDGTIVVVSRTWQEVTYALDQNSELERDETGLAIVFVIPLETKLKAECVLPKWLA